MLQAIILYIPCIIAFVLYFLLQKSQRLNAALIVSLCWQLAILSLANMWAVEQGWWAFSPIMSDQTIPLWLLFSWIVLWGPVALGFFGLFSRMAKPVYSGGITISVLVIVDILLMPLLDSYVMLRSDWLWGELFLIMTCLVPALGIIHIFWLRVQPLLRGFVAAVIFLLILLVHVPAAFGGYQNSDLMQSWQAITVNLSFVELTPYVFLLIPAASAVTEFGKRGNGTPLPFDPPQKLVTNGVYAYCRNPMQISIVLLCFVHALTLSNVWMLILVVVTIVYCEGIAFYSERHDLEKRYGSAGERYSKQVPRWGCRLRPALTKGMQASIYFDFKCDVCSQIRKWFEKQNAVGLIIKDANKVCGSQIGRVRYCSEDFIAEGPTAIAYALQHINLGWAFIGWIATLPGVSVIVDLTFDYQRDRKRSVRKKA